MTQKAFGTFLKGYRKKDFTVGTLFPDIYHINGVEKEKTHSKNPPRHDSLPKGSFLSGTYFHSLVDHAQGDFIMKHRIHSLCSGAAYVNDAFKLLTDEVLYGKIKDWRTIIRYLDTILAQEIAFGIKRDTIRRWHIILRTYLGHAPSRESRRELQFAYHVPTEKIEAIETSIQQLKANKISIEIIEDFYSNFETLLK